MYNVTEHTESARFYALQLFVDSVNEKWSRLAEADKAGVKAMCIESLEKWPCPGERQHLRIKLASFTAEVAKREWPQRYS